MSRALAGFHEALRPHLTGGVYMNFLEGAASRARIADGYSPEAYRWLRALKRQWDPEKRFSHSFAVEPL